MGEDGCGKFSKLSRTGSQKPTDSITVVANEELFLEVSWIWGRSVCIVPRSFITTENSDYQVNFTFNDKECASTLTESDSIGTHKKIKLNRAYVSKYDGKTVQTLLLYKF